MLEEVYFNLTSGVLDVKVDGESVVTNGVANIDGKADVGHTHEIKDILELQSTLDSKVDKEEGKGLSTNDFTDELKTKLEGIEDSAEVNVIDEIVVKDESIVSMSGKKATIDLDAYAKKADITTVLRFKGVKDYQRDLPTEGVELGDVWLVKYRGVLGTRPLNAEFVCVNKSPVEWEQLGAIIDLSNYYTKPEVDKAISDEVTRATEAESELETSISDEIARATAAESELETAISDEVTRAQGAEEALASRLDIIEGNDDGSIKKALKDAKEYADSLDTAMDERVNALEADTHIHDNKTVLDGITSTKVSSWDNTVTGLAAEVTRATEAEEELEDKINGKQDLLTAGTGILIDNNTIAVDDVTFATVEYVDANISDTMAYIIQEDRAEHAGRVAGDELLDGRLNILEGDDSTAGSIKKTVKDAIEALDVDEVGGTYIQKISESDGKITATAGTFGTVASGNTLPVTGGAVYAAIQESATVQSVKVTGASPVMSSETEAQKGDVEIEISLATGYGDVQNPYGAKSAGMVLAGPASGDAANPSFRALVADDISDIEWMTDEEILAILNE